MQHESGGRAADELRGRPRQARLPRRRDVGRRCPRPRSIATSPGRRWRRRSTTRRTPAGSRSSTAGTTTRGCSICTASAAGSTAAPRRSPRPRRATSTCFQRPDATDVHFDPMRTLARRRRHHAQARPARRHQARGATASAANLRTPGLELNDIGFQTQSDRNLGFVYGEYRDDDPSDDVPQLGGQRRRVRASTLRAAARDLRLRVQRPRAAPRTTGSSRPAATSRTIAGTRRRSAAGPRCARIRGYNGYFEIDTDTRKRVWCYGSTCTPGRCPRRTSSTVASTSARPSRRGRTSISIVGPSLFERDDPMQYVAQATDTGELDALRVRRGSSRRRRR